MLVCMRVCVCAGLISSWMSESAWRFQTTTYFSASLPEPSSPSLCGSLQFALTATNTISTADLSPACHESVRQLRHPLHFLYSLPASVLHTLKISAAWFYQHRTMMQTVIYTLRWDPDTPVLLQFEGIGFTCCIIFQWVFKTDKPQKKKNYLFFFALALNILHIGEVLSHSGHRYL